MKAAKKTSATKKSTKKTPAAKRSAPATKVAKGKAAPRKAAAPKKPGRKAPAVSGERAQLIGALSKQLSLSAAQVELRALRELAAKLGNAREEAAPRAHANGAHGSAWNGGPTAAESQPAAPTAPPPPAREGSLPQRLYLLLEGRGLSHGLPVEVIDTSVTIGSGKFCTVWINSPQIETRHLQIQQDGDSWVLTDLNSAHGTLVNNEPLVEPRVIQHGDEYRLAGYLRMRTELR